MRIRLDGDTLTLDLGARSTRHRRIGLYAMLGGLVVAGLGAVFLWFAPGEKLFRDMLGGGGGVFGLGFAAAFCVERIVVSPELGLRSVIIFARIPVFRTDIPLENLRDVRIESGPEDWDVTLHDGDGTMLRRLGGIPNVDDAVLVRQAIQGTVDSNSAIETTLPGWKRARDPCRHCRSPSSSRSSVPGSRSCWGDSGSRHSTVVRRDSCWPRSFTPCVRRLRCWFCPHPPAAAAVRCATHLRSSLGGATDGCLGGRIGSGLVRTPGWSSTLGGHGIGR